MRMRWIEIPNIPRIHDSGELETAIIYLTVAGWVRWINIPREDGLEGGLDWFE
jgi:hypothetical protein